MVATEADIASDPIQAGYALRNRDGRPLDQRAALAWCERYAKRQYENFTVVSWFLPKQRRAAMYGLYAFCRFTDDLGDEARGDRLALLDEWERDLERGFAGEGRHPIMVALGMIAQQRPLSIDSCRRLIEANRRDQRQTRYETFQDVLEYCEYSANPVGHMVLSLFDHTDEERRAFSDATCTALQLANHWQDVARDYAIGRLYLPGEDLRHFGVSEAQIAEGRCDDNFRALMRFEVDRAETLFRRGMGLVPLVAKDLRLDLELFTAGGRAVLRAIEAQGYDVLSHRPTISDWQKGRLALHAAARHWIGGR